MSKRHRIHKTSKALSLLHYFRLVLKRYLMIFGVG